MPTESQRTSSRPWLREAAQRLAATPFGRLVSHFLQKMVHTADLDLGVEGLLGLLAAPGTFVAVMMLEKYSTLLSSPYFRGNWRDDLYVTSIPDKYLFIALAMALAGTVTVLKWDQILPDARDYLNLAPLPIPSRRILFANASAILIAVTVLAFDLNAGPSVLFPLFVSAAARATVAASLHFFAVHILCLLLGSVFAVAGVFALLGAASALLPREAFRACSPWLRGAILLAMTALLFSAFAGPAVYHHLQQAPDSVIRYLPPLWYLALYQVLQQRATPVLEELARFGLWALAGTLALTVIVYMLGYRRRYAAILEGPRPAARQRVARVVLAVLDAFAPRRPGFARAGHRFVVRALLRSETHRMVIAVALGFGWMAAFQGSGGAALAMAYLLVLGLRVAFDLPADLPANWLFRVVLDPQRSESLGVVRRVMLSFLAPLVLAPCFAVACRETGPLRATGHMLYVLALSLILVEMLLSGYRKLPLTCAMPGFRDNFLVLCLGQFLAFELFTRAGAAVEEWMWAAPWRFLLLPIAMAWAWRWNQGRLAEAREAGELEEGLTFENPGVTDVQRLDLSDA